MKVYNGLGDLNIENNLVVAFGNFDGIHLGHKELINRTIELAKEMDAKPAMFTLDPHPLKVLQPDNCPPFLLTMEDKIKLIANQGIQVLIVSEFSSEMASVESDTFIQKIIIEKLKAKAVVVGYNYSFGKGGTGTPETLSKFAADNHFRMAVVSPVTVDGKIVSSTLIRSLILEGRVEEAAKLLGYLPFLSGRVVNGAKLGRQIGFPTANLDIPENIVVPAKGVYATRVLIGGSTYCGVANIGYKPTLSENGNKNLEVNIFNFNQDIYGKKIKVEFVVQIREEKQFSDLKALQEQICQDVSKAKNILEISEGYKPKYS